MIFIFGSTQKGATVRPLLDTHCYPCQRTTTWDWYRVTEWMSVFFLPVLPVNSKHFLLCRGCKDHLQLEPDDVKGVKRLRQLTGAESKTLHDRLVERLETHQLSEKTATQREYLKSRR